MWTWILTLLGLGKARVRGAVAGASTVDRRGLPLARGS